MQFLIVNVAVLLVLLLVFLADGTGIGNFLAVSLP